MSEKELEQASVVSEPSDPSDEQEEYQLEGVTIEDLQATLKPPEFDQRTVMSQGGISQGGQSVNVNVRQGGDGDDWYKLAEFALVNARRLAILGIGSATLFGAGYLGVSVIPNFF